jgi:hypothetical protein
MGELLRSLGISESGIDPPALYVVMAALVCLIVHAQLRNRPPITSFGILAAFYVGAIITAAAAMLIIFPIENENLRYVLGFIYLGGLIIVVRFLARRYLGVSVES